MQYFTKEELEDITNSLLQEPSRETLKRLNDKYNKEEIKEETGVPSETPNIQQETIVPSFDIPTFNNEVKIEPEKESNSESPAINQQSFNVPEFNIPFTSEEINNAPVQEPVGVSNSKPEVQSNIDIPNMNSNMAIPNLPTNNFEVPKPVLEVNNSSFVDTQIPSLNNGAVPNQSNEPVNFSGNLWQQPIQEPVNLMDTTDNFKIDINSTPNMTANINTSQNSNPFFGNQSMEKPEANNPIPVRGQTMAGPSMFGQIMQNQ